MAFVLIIVIVYALILRKKFLKDKTEKNIIEIYQVKIILLLLEKL